MKHRKTRAEKMIVAHEGRKARKAREHVEHKTYETRGT